MPAYIDEEDWDGPHTNDDGEPCNCTQQECGYNEEGEGLCPECGSTEHSLVHGDHGYRCDKCGEEFTCP